MRITKARRKMLREAGAKGGRSRSEAKIETVRANGRKHLGRVKTLAEIVSEEAVKFKVAHPDLVPD